MKNKPVSLACVLLLTISAYSLSASHNVSTPFHYLQAIAELKTASYVAIDERGGLLALNASFENVDRVAGEYMLLDIRSQATHTTILTVDVASAAPNVIHFSDGGFSQAQVLRKPAFNIEALCLYEREQGELFAFLLDGNGGGEMRWLRSAAGSVFDLSVKHLRLPPGSESCTVHDASDSLFVSEENLGFWRYPANPETSRDRELVDLLVPRGHMNSAPEVLRIEGEVLLVAGESYVASYANSKHGWRQVKKRSTKIQEASDVLVSGNRLMIVGEQKNELLKLSAFKPRKTVVVKNNPLPELVPLVETDPVNRTGDAADDPAIWLHPSQAEKSLVLGTNKKWGMMVYQLDGKQVQALPSGHINNVDIRQNLRFNQQSWDIAVGSNRSDNSIAVYRIGASGTVTEVASIPTELPEVYGICLYAPNPNTLYSFINDKNGLIQQWQIMVDAQQRVSGKLIRNLRVPSQPEGCVVNDATGELFIGEEDVGIWLFNANAQSSETGRLLHRVNEHLHADVEGLGLVKNSLGHYLLVSSQGNNSYAVFEADPPYTFVAAFRVGFNGDARIDGASETDGLAVSGVNFGAQFPEGLLVVQDGVNLLPERPQNFKLLSWRDVMKTIRAQTSD